MVFLHFQLWAGGCTSSASGRRPRVLGPVFLWFSYGFPMVFLWFSYTFNSGPVAGDAPPVAAVRGCPAPFSYAFPMVFLHFQLWAGGCSSSTGGWSRHWSRPLFRCFPMVFLWFSYTFSSGPVAGDPEALHRQISPVKVRSTGELTIPPGNFTGDHTVSPEILPPSTGENTVSPENFRQG